MDTLTVERVVCVVLMLGSVIHSTGFYIDDDDDDDPLRGSDSLVVSGAGSGCQYEDAECTPHAGGDALIRPVSRVVTTPRPPTTRGPPTTTADPDDVGAASSGESLCEGDDEDCSDDAASEGSGAAHVDIIIDPVPPSRSPGSGSSSGTGDDIVIESDKNVGSNGGDSGGGGRDGAAPAAPTLSPPLRNQPAAPSTDSILLGTVNMTETPTKSRGSGFGVTRRGTTAPHREVTETASVAPGRGGGGASGGEEAGAEGGPRQGGIKDRNPFSLSIGVIVGIAAGVILLLLILAYAVYKYKSRDEGSYKVDESKNYRYDSCNTKPPPPSVNGAGGFPPKSGGTPTKPKKKDVKEWYV